MERLFNRWKALRREIGRGVLFNDPRPGRVRVGADRAEEPRGKGLLGERRDLEGKRITGPGREVIDIAQEGRVFR